MFAVGQRDTATFMPSRPARMLMGSASTVTTVSTNRLRLLASCTLAASSSCSSDALLQAPKSRSTTENSSVESRSSCTSSAPIQVGGCCSKRNKAAGSGPTAAAAAPATAALHAQPGPLVVGRPASNSSSMPSMRWVTPRTMSTSPAAWVRISCSSSATLERGV